MPILQDIKLQRGQSDVNKIVRNGNVVYVKRDPALLKPIESGKVIYSLRRVRTAYEGQAIRVRRSSDNAEQDVGFLGNTDLDTVSLLAFVGSGDGFVSIWYDQSLTAFNATQSILARQPKIVSGGVVETLNGKPTLKFGDGGLTLLTLGANFIFSNTNGLVVNFVAEPTSAAASRFCFDFGNIGSANYGVQLPTTFFRIMSPNHQENLAETMVFGAYEAVWDFSPASNRLKINGADKILDVFINTEPNATFLNASNIAESATSVAGAGPFTIGAQSKSGSQSSRFFEGSLSEFIIFVETDTSGAHDNQRTFYGTA